MNDPVIEAVGATKFFGAVAALDGLNFRLNAGSVCGVLGVNGAGKTTLMRALAGLIRPDAGSLRIFGTEAWALGEPERREIAYAGQDMQLPGWMTAAQACRLHSRVHLNWNADLAAELLREFGISESVRFFRLSHGQRQKLVLVLAICQEARLLLLDEPMNGLDVPGRRAVLDRLLDIVSGDGRTILLSSHLLGDLERIADQVAVIHRGRLIFHEGLDELKASARKIRIPAAVPREVVGEFFPILRYEQTPNRETVVSVLRFNQASLQRLLDLAGVDCADEHGLNLEDLFMEIIETQTPIPAGGLL